MSAKVRKIRSEIKSSPKTILGMLQGDSDLILHIAAVVIWKDGRYQMVNDAMTLSEHAFAIAVMQKHLLDEID